MAILSKELIRTDRNGSKYYSVKETCFKCNGTGHIEYYGHIYNGVCFKCGGTGVVSYTEKVMTPEYEAKLNERRKARQEKRLQEEIAKSAEVNKQFFKENGFDELGVTYVVLGNTFEIKDQLKELGCKFNNILGWHSPNKLEGFEMLEVDVDDVYYKDCTHTYKWNSFVSDTTVVRRIEEANLNLVRKNSVSEYIGEEKQRIEVKVTFSKLNWYDTMYGTTFVYTFIDENKNVIIWKTSGTIDAEKGDTLTIKGTVKEHSEYNGVKQTVLTRCKVMV